MKIEIQKFYHYRNIDNILISNRISLVEKNCKYFIGYMVDDYRSKPLDIRLPKTSTYVKSYDSKTKWIYFSIEEDILLKNMTIFGMKSAIV